MVREMKIRPAGMSLERAMEIAMAALDVTAPVVEAIAFTSSPTYVGATHGFHVNSGSNRGRALTAEQREQVLRLSRQGVSVNRIAIDTGVSSRTVNRIRADARQATTDQADAAWMAEQQRLHNLASFRRNEHDHTESRAAA